VRFGDELIRVGGNLFATSNNYGIVGRYGRDIRTFTVSACP
jgi:hypothetical protein